MSLSAVEPTAPERSIMARSRRSHTIRIISFLLPVVTGIALVVLNPAPALAITVTGHSPIPGEEVVPLDTNVTVTFDVAAVGVNGTTFTLERGVVAVPAVVSGAGTSWTLNPTGNLDPGTTYTASLRTGITDVTMAALTPESWSFTTDAPPPPDGTLPRVVDVSPNGGAIEVPIGASVRATFSEPVEGVDETTFTLRTGVTNVSANVTGAGTAWTLNPLDSLAEDTRYTARLAGEGITDRAANVFPGTTWVFRTAGGAAEPGDDVRRPRVVNEFPRDGATGVSRFTDVRAHFSEAVGGVTNRTFRLFNARTGNVVAAEVFRSGRSNRWVLEPDARLARLTRYVVQLRGGASGIRDLAGNRRPTTTWSFRTSG
jgi:hypothetical protein